MPAQDIYSFLSVLLNDYQLDRITYTELKQPINKFQIELVFSDYYRQRLTNENLVKLAGNRDHVSQRIIWSENKFNYGLQIELDSRFIEFDNRKDATAVTGHYRLNSRSGFIMGAFGNNRALWGARLHLSDTDFSSPLKVNNYPTSDNSALNNFFLDYLEPTFGQNLTLTGSTRLLQPQLFTTLPLTDQLKIDLNYRHKLLIFDPVLTYDNNSNIAQLTGHRKMTYSGDIIDNVVEIGLTHPQWPAYPAVILFNGNLDLAVENPLPAGTISGLPDLGWVEGHRQGVTFKIEGSLDCLFYQIGCGYSQLSAEADISTPVLGREILLPVAHRITADLSGSTTTEQIIISYFWERPNWNTHLNARYAHGYYNLQVKGDAILMFGLTSVPVDYPLQYHLHLITFQCHLEKQFGQLNLRYEFTQYLPYLKRVDDSPINFKPEVKEPDYKTRGGGQHRLSIYYRF